MTRGTFYLITSDGEIYQSIEFNGDMYLDDYGYGADAIEILEKARTQADITPEKFKQLIIEFNESHHKYDDIDDDDGYIKNRRI